MSTNKSDHVNPQKDGNSRVYGKPISSDKPSPSSQKVPSNQIADGVLPVKKLGAFRIPKRKSGGADTITVQKLDNSVSGDVNCLRETDSGICSIDAKSTTLGCDKLKDDKSISKSHKTTRNRKLSADTEKRLDNSSENLANLNTQPIQSNPKNNTVDIEKQTIGKDRIKRGRKRKSDLSPENLLQQSRKAKDAPNKGKQKEAQCLSRKSIQLSLTESWDLPNIKGRPRKSNPAKSVKDTAPSNIPRAVSVAADVDPENLITGDENKAEIKNSDHKRSGRISSGKGRSVGNGCADTAAKETPKGRPKQQRKLKIAEDISSDENENEDTPLKSSGRQAGRKPASYREDVSSDEKSVSPKIPQERPKRGRKSKAAGGIARDEDEEKTEPKPRPGRKAEVVQESSDEDALLSRRKGQKPASYKDGNTDSDGEKPASSETLKKKPKRGRKPKVTKEVDSDEDEEETLEAKPRRGRKPKDVQTSSVEPKSKRGKKKTVVQESTCDDEGEKELKCSHCDVICGNYTKMKSHYASIHTLLYSKTNPEGSDDLKSLKIICKLMGGRLICKTCKKSIKTPGYYKQHVDWCNSDKTMMEKCQHCGNEYKKFWLHTHELVCVRKKAEMEAQRLKAKKVPSPTTPIVGKRKAARKAMSVIKNISQEKEEVLDWTSMVRVPPMTVPSKETLDQWEKCVSLDEAITCAHEDCSVQYKSVEQMTEHYWTCVSNGLSSHTWNCKICAKKFQSEDKAVSHVKMTHGTKKRKIKEEDEYRSDGMSASDDDITSGDPTDEEDGPDPGDESDVEKPRSRNGARDLKAYFYSTYNIRPTYSIKNLCQSLHAVSKPRIASLLPDQHHVAELLKDDLLGGKTSIRFRLESTPETHQLRAEQTVSHTKTGSHVVYIGKPIRLIACCPIDSGTEQDVLSGDQFYAIISTNDKSFQNVKETYSCPGVVYVWRIANLKSKTSPISATLYLNLPHNLGHIHQMRWCYDGGFLQTPGDVCSRLGLLALASSDGCVHIISVPFLPPKQDEGTCWTYPVVDSLKLAVEGNSAQCTCVDWQRQDTKMVVAGFNDGSVAIWYVDGDTSPKVIHPIKVFRSHPSLMTAVAWCPYDSDIFATFSYGWFVWDMKDLGSPYFTPKFSEYGVDLNTRAVWSRIHHVMISCTDPSFGSPSVMLTGIGYDCISSNQKYPVRDLLHTSDCDVCDCCDIIAVSDSSGTVGWHDKILPKYEKGSDKYFVKSEAMTTIPLEEVEEGEVVAQFKYLLKEKQKLQGAKTNLCHPKLLMKNDRTHSIDAEGDGVMPSIDKQRLRSLSKRLI